MHAHWDCSRGLSTASLLSSCIGAADSNAQSRDWCLSLEGLLPLVFDGLVNHCRLKPRRCEATCRSQSLTHEISLNEAHHVCRAKLDDLLGRSNHVPIQVAECARAVLRETCDRVGKVSGDSVLCPEEVKDVILAVGVMWCLDRLSVRSVSCSLIPIDIVDATDDLASVLGLPVEVLESTPPYIAKPALDLLKVATHQYHTKHVAGRSPPMIVHKLVSGSADTPVPHETTTALGESVRDPPLLPSPDLWKMDELCTLEANIDDCTAEQLSFCVDVLLQEGAADAWVTPIVMKKGRAAHTIHCLCRVEQKESLLQVLFRNSTTLGIRVRNTDRIALQRKMLTVQTEWKENELEGRVNVKAGYLGQDVVSLKAEFDHCRILSLSTKKPISLIAETAVQLARQQLTDEMKT